MILCLIEIYENDHHTRRRAPQMHPTLRVGDQLIHMTKLVLDMATSSYSFPDKVTTRGVEWTRSESKSLLNEKVGRADASPLVTTTKVLRRTETGRGCPRLSLLSKMVNIIHQLPHAVSEVRTWRGS